MKICLKYDSASLISSACANEASFHFVYSLSIVSMWCFALRGGSARSFRAIRQGRGYRVAIRQTNQGTT